METFALAAILLVMVGVAGWLRARAIKTQIESQKFEDTEAALDTTRRIEDATRLPPATDDARDWLRDFGGDASSRKR